MEIRLLNEADAEPYCSLRLRMLREYPDAFTSSHDEEALKPLSWTQERLKSSEVPPVKFVLGAFSETGRLLGSVGLSVEERRKQRHKAHLFGMFTATEERNKGVGRALLAECLSRASRIPGLEQINLTVTEGNPAERLYASVGFERFGIEQRALKCDGQYYGKVHMVLSRASSLESGGSSPSLLLPWAKK
jgi:RimJ/RimL family protein N-acetyltransferase